MHRIQKNGSIPKGTKENSYAIRSYDQILADQSPDPVATNPPTSDTATEMTID